MLNKPMTTLLTVMLCANLVGCATTSSVGVGTIVSAKKIQDERYKPQSATITGAEAGVASGATAGAIYGTIAGATAAGSLAIFGPSTTPLMVSIIATGAGVGAIAGGIEGGLVGGGLGYAVDVAEQKSLYEYTVKQDNLKTPVTVIQHSSAIPVDARVEILKKNDALFVKQVSF